MRQIVLDIDAGSARLALIFSMKASTLRTSLRASATVGSSSTMRSASKCIARPIATPWRSPPDSLLTVESGVDADAAEADGVEQDAVGDLLLAAWSP